MDSAAVLQIDTLRLRARSGDALGRELRTATLLEQGDYRPPGVPPSAILVVRALQDPLPGKLTDVRAGIRLNPDWERAVKSQLASLYEQALRPIAEPVPETALAVVFSDQAELLACLGKDLFRHRLHQRWWWRSFLRRYPLLPDPEGWCRILCEHAELVPQILAVLREQGDETAALASLSGGQALRVLEAVLAAYHSSGLAGDLTSADDVRPRADEPSAAPRQETAGRDSSGKTDPSILPPWTMFLDSGVSLGHRAREREALRGVCLVLTHRPGWIGTGRFRETFRAWWTQAGESGAGTDRAGRREQGPLPQETSREHRPENRPAELSNEKNAHPRDAFVSPPPGSPAEATPETETSGRPADDRPAGERNAGRVRGSKNDTGKPGDRPGRSASQQSGQERDAAAPDTSSPNDFPREEAGTGGPEREAPDDHRPLSPDKRRDAPQVPGERQGQDAGVAPGRSGISDVPEQATAESDRSPETETEIAIPGYGTAETRVSTDLAGLFYLINFMSHLGLPEIFDDDWDLSAGTSPWALLEVMARGLAAGTEPDLREDAVWRLLAVLDGREPGTVPGEGYKGSESFRLPAAWRDPGASEEWLPRTWAWTRSRVAVWAANELLLLDLPREGNSPARQTRRALDRMGYGAAQYSLRRRSYPGPPEAPVFSHAGDPPTNGLLRWLGWTLPYLRDRLDAALRSDDSSTDDTLAALLRCPGDIFVTSSHIDVVFPLDRISLPVRMAGLDRDPGWQPLFGRVVLFHFE